MQTIGAWDIVLGGGRFYAFRQEPHTLPRLLTPTAAARIHPQESLPPFSRFAAITLQLRALQVIARALGAIK